jgi:hypothetical protein
MFSALGNSRLARRLVDLSFPYSSDGMGSGSACLLPASPSRRDDPSNREFKLAFPTPRSAGCGWRIDQCVAPHSTVVC